MSDPQFLPPDSFTLQRVEPGQLTDGRIAVVFVGTEEQRFAIILDRENLPRLASGLMEADPSAVPAETTGVVHTASSGHFRWDVALSPTPSQPVLRVEIEGRPGLHLTLSPTEALSMGERLIAQAAACRRSAQ